MNISTGASSSAIINAIYGRSAPMRRDNAINFKSLTVAITIYHHQR